MTIHHNALSYIFPGFLVILLMGGIITEAEKGEFIIAAVGIIVLCIIHHFHTSLSFKDGLIKGKVGLIKTKTLTSPVGKIQYCEFTKFLCFNQIKINAITGTYSFKNMSHAKEFVDMVNTEMAKTR